MTLINPVAELKPGVWVLAKKGREATIRDGSLHTDPMLLVGSMVPVRLTKLSPLEVHEGYFIRLTSDEAREILADFQATAHTAREEKVFAEIYEHAVWLREACVSCSEQEARGLFHCLSLVNQILERRDPTTIASVNITGLRSRRMERPGTRDDLALIKAQRDRAARYAAALQRLAELGEERIRIADSVFAPLYGLTKEEGDRHIAVCNGKIAATELEIEQIKLKAARTELTSLDRAMMMGMQFDEGEMTWDRRVISMTGSGSFVTLDDSTYKPMVGLTGPAGVTKPLAEAVQSDAKAEAAREARRLKKEDAEVAGIAAQLDHI